MKNYEITWPITLINVDIKMLVEKMFNQIQLKQKNQRTLKKPFNKKKYNNLLFT